MSRILIRRQFGLPADPWAHIDIPTLDGSRVAEMVGAAATAKAMVSITGARGSGKSRAVRDALTGLDVRVVEPLRLDRERLHLGDIQDAIVRDLSDETPRRSGEARSHQARKILGKASEQHSVLLLLDDAHVLHSQTLRGLKRLRELTWLGKSPLLGIVLIGQRDRADAAPEVSLRTDSLSMAGLAESEAAAALDAALNGQREVLDVEARDLLAAHKRARNWLDLLTLADAALAEAAARGEDTVTRATLKALVGDARQEAAPTATAPPDDGAVSQLLQARAARKAS